MTGSPAGMSPERLWYGVAIPLARLLDADGGACPIALPDALGDRYLCRHNPVYAAIRGAALGFGYRFSAIDTPLWRDYTALPLTTLHRILGEKTIPYFDTAETLHRLLEINPAAALSPGLILDARRNHTFHEAAHCVTHAVLSEHELAAELRVIAADPVDRAILEVIFAEAFANTVEKLGTLCARMPLWDHIFYSLNSYIGRKDKMTAVLEKAQAEAGDFARFQLLFLASFEANLTLGEPDDATCRRILNAAGATAFSDETAREVIGSGFNLSDHFREFTGPAYFEFLGWGAAFQALRQRSWLDESGASAVVRQLLGRLFAIVSPLPGSGPDQGHSTLIATTR